MCKRPFQHERLFDTRWQAQCSKRRTPESTSCSRSSDHRQQKCYKNMGLGTGGVCAVWFLGPLRGMRMLLNFLVVCFLETDPRHRICKVIFVHCLFFKARFWSLKKIAKYCWSLSPFNKHEFLNCLARATYIGVRDMHKTFQNMT